MTARSKYILGAAAASAVAVATIAIAASSRESRDAPVQHVATSTPPQRAKFTMPVADLKASAAGPKTAAKPAAPPTVPAPAPGATTGPAPTIAQPATGGNGRDAKTKSPAPQVAEAAPTAPAPTIVASAAIPDSDMDAVVETKVKAIKVKPDKKSGAKRVAVDAETAEAKASALYRAGKFSEAAELLRAFARSADSATKRSLDGKAASYVSFGKAYVQGMTSNNAIAAYVSLRSATKYDQSLGGAFDEALSGRMKQIAPKAAVAYIAADKPTDAHLAVQTAQRVGAGKDSNVAVVRQKLESAAAKLYAEAQKDLQDNPSEAKEKFRQIKDMVDVDSPWFEKAASQLK